MPLAFKRGKALTWKAASANKTKDSLENAMMSMEQCEQKCAPSRIEGVFKKKRVGGKSWRVGVDMLGMKL